MYANNLFIPWTSSYIGSVIKMALTEIENPSDIVSKISACYKMSFLLLIITHECLITLNFGVRLNILISSVGFSFSDFNSNLFSHAERGESFDNGCC